MHDMAFSEADELVLAEDAVSGKVYFCTTCGCEMYKTCRRKTHYFACMPGHEHTKNSCDRVEKNKNVRKIGLTRCGIFHAWLMTEPRPGTGGSGGGGGNGAGGDGGPMIRALPYKSLEDLYLNSLHTCDDMEIGDGMLTDLLISSKTSSCVMMTNEALGPRALQVKIDKCFDDRNVIRFVLCDNEGSRKKVFDIFFEDRENYQNWVDKLFFSYVDEEGVTQNDVKYRFVLIHGDWCDMPIDACRTVCNKRCAGKWVCTGYQYSFYAGRRQIFCPSDQIIKR